VTEGISIVEETLRNQREMWREIATRVSGISHRELPPEAPKRLVLFGVGSSHYAAKLTALSLIRDKYRTRVPVVSCASNEIGIEIIPNKGDWAFAFSHRGATPWTLKALEAFNRAGAFTLMVAAQGAPESEFARFHLPTSPLERVEPHTMAVTGAVCAVTTLISGSRAFEEWDALRSIGDPDLDLMRRKAGKGPSVLLGEWEGEWLAHEGALKFMEMARLPVRSFGSEEFFHGPRFSVKSEDPIWHVSLAKDPRNADIDALGPAHRVEVSVASPLAWVPALVQLQWLALATALNLENNPDGPQNSV
jgi:fructoselysine-6-P-deglycase FrlB-like protein